MNKLVKLSLAAAALVLAVSSNSANATVISTTPDCSVAAAVFNPDYSDCSGAYALGNGENDVTDGDADNIVNQILNVDDIFGVDDWSFMGKIDTNLGSNDYFAVSGINSTTGTITFDVAAINLAFGPDFLNTYEIAVSFKASTNFSIYQWDAPIWGTGSTATIDWSTAGTATNNNGNVQDLSHASVYFRNTSLDPDPGAVVPEPSSIALLALGLIGFGWSRRYSRK